MFETDTWDYSVTPGFVLDVVCENERYLPTYANSTDACMDLKIRIPSGCAVIPPQSMSEVYGTGIKVKIPEEHVMLIFPRSSTGFKLHCMLVNTTGVIDSGYRDEIKVKLFNYDMNEETVLTDGQRIAQFMIIPRPNIIINTVSDDENFRSNDRGGGIGSTGN